MSMVINCLKINFIGQFIDKIAITICDKIHLTNPQHPLLMKRDIINFIIENGQSNFNNDLFEKDDALIILNCISKTLFEDMKMMCTCTLRFDCYLLNQVYQMFNLVIIVFIINIIMCFT